MKKIRIESVAWRLSGSTLFYPGDYRVPEDVSAELAERMVSEGAAVVVVEEKKETLKLSKP